ncbi:unnamed protein product [Gordionus sp. m RMFG-2023]|uniref:sex peptide receptor-related protein 2-like n=1 Tax=Gordionus sp. m RMFG-2023 TaxID=3053472 RepID=UPI0030E5674A
MKTELNPFAKFLLRYNDTAPVTLNYANESDKQIYPQHYQSYNLITKDKLFILESILFGYISPWIIFLTFFANSLIVIILIKGKKICRLKPIELILIALAIYSFLLALSPLPWYLYFFLTGGYRKTNLYGCYLFHYGVQGFPSMFHTMTILSTSFLAYQRYSGLYLNKYAVSCDTRHGTCSALLFIVIFSILFHAVGLFGYNIDIEISIQLNVSEDNPYINYYCTRNMNPWFEKNHVIYENLKNILRSILIDMIPFILMTTCNYYLIKAIQKGKKNVKLLTEIRNRRNSMKAKDLTRSTRMLIVVLCLYIYQIKI